MNEMNLKDLEQLRELVKFKKEKPEEFWKMRDKLAGEKLR